MKGLRAGGRALVIRSGQTENLGREVEVQECLGFRERGERILLGCRAIRVKTSSVHWLIRGFNAPLVGVLLKTGEQVPAWELAAPSFSLLPLDEDDPGAFHDEQLSRPVADKSSDKA